MNEFTNLAHLKLSRTQISIARDLQQRGLEVFLPLFPCVEYDFLVKDTEGGIGHVGAFEVAA